LHFLIEMMRRPVSVCAHTTITNRSSSKPKVWNRGSA
jgi:hypothetical protein